MTIGLEGKRKRCFWCAIIWVWGGKKEKEGGRKGRFWGRERKGGESGHASVPGHQLCVGRIRREEERRRRRRKSGEGGREQHHTSRSYIGGAWADAAGKHKQKGRGGALSMALLEIYFLKMVGHPSWDREFSFFCLSLIMENIVTASKTCRNSEWM